MDRKILVGLVGVTILGLGTIYNIKATENKPIHEEKRLRMRKEGVAPTKKKTAEEWDEEHKKRYEREIEKRQPYVPKYIEEIEEAMEKGTLGVGEPSVADWAIVELGLTRDPRGVPALIKVLKNYKTTSQEAVEDFLKQNWVSVDRILERYNMKELDIAKVAEEWASKPRKDAAEALGRIGDIYALPVLREAFEKDKSREVRAAVAYAIFDVRLKEEGYDGVRYPIVLEAIPALEKLLNDEDEIVRYYAALSFAQVRGISDTDKDRTLSIIQELSLKAKYELIRDFATDRLKKIEEKKGLFIK